MKDTEIFHKLVRRAKGGKRGPMKHQNEGQQSSQNRFDVLEEDEAITKADQDMGGSLEEKGRDEDCEQTQDINKQKEIMMSDVELGIDQEMT